jgi:hypothetical protein
LAVEDYLMDEVKAIEKERKARPRVREYDETVDTRPLVAGVWFLVLVECAHLAYLVLTDMGIL